MKHRAPVKRVHDMPNGGTCTHPEPQQCTDWNHLSYEAKCSCGTWEMTSKVRSALDLYRRHHIDTGRTAS